jgi:hypothetical protein
MLAALAVGLGAAGCAGNKATDATTTRVTAAPNPSPSVWTMSGPPAISQAASTALLRQSDLPKGFTPMPLEVPAVKAVRPPTCKALWGPGTGILGGAAGRAATAFVGGDYSTAVAHSVGVYTTPAAGVAAVEFARKLGRTCATTVVDGVTFAVTAIDRPGLGGTPGVTLVLRQSKGVGQTSVTVSGRMVSVLAIASRPPGPLTAVVQQANVAAARRLTEAAAAGT